MAAIALRREGSFSSGSGSDYGSGSNDDDHGLGYGGGGARGGHGGGGALGYGNAGGLGYGNAGGLGYGNAGGLGYGNAGGLGYGNAGGLGYGGGGMPTGASLYGHGQGFGPGLSSLQYNPDGINRRQSLQENQRLSQSSGLGDDLSLIGECDNNSIRSDRQRPGRRSSLSAAIELTRDPPPKNTLPSGPKRGRRSSFFGNGNKEKAEKPDAEAAARQSVKRGSRRASMAGYPAGKEDASAEPELTPAFFQPRKKDRARPHPPDRRRTKSFEKDDPRAGRITSQIRPGEKIKRPGKGGSRRASMSAIPRRMSLSRSGASKSSKGSNRSINSGSNNSGSDSYDDVSDDEDYYGFKTSNNDSYGRSKKDKNKNVNDDDLGYGDDNEYDPQLPPNPRPGSTGTGKRNFKRRSSKKGYSNEDLGYGDSEEFDPQLPPPPPPQEKRPGASSSLKKAFRSRRGSTGTAASFNSTSAAQRSLKDSLNWKAMQQKPSPTEMYSNTQHSNATRRSSVASSTATSVATDVASNVNKKGPTDIPPPPRHGPSDIPPPRRGPSDIPPPRHGPSDVPPPGRRGPADLPPGRRGPLDVPPGHRGPSDVPPGRRGPPDVPPGPRRPSDVPPSARPESALAMSDMDSSASSFSMDMDGELNLKATPIQSNRKVPDLHGSQQSGVSLLGNASNAGNASGNMIMDDVSDGSHSSAGGALSMNTGSHERRRASRGMSVLQAGPTSGAGQASSILTHGSTGGLHGSSMGGFNPYGSTRMAGSEEDDEEETEATETEEDTGEANENTALEKAPSEDESAPAAAKALSEEGGAPTVDSTTDTEHTVPTLTNTDESGITDIRIPKRKDHDDGSDGSMTSEIPNEQDNMKDVDDQLGDIEATGDWSQIHSGVQDGDWSRGVRDDMLVSHSKAARIVDRNNLLDQYPGSEADYDRGGLAYGYGPGAMDAYDDESERKDADPEYENGYGPSDLYDEDYSSMGWRESRPRAADSIEFINMEQLMSKAKNNKGLHLPTFTPAHGCTNASDFIVRCFVARLRAGMTVTKHSRSRFCKSHDRILHILPTGYHVTWIPETEEEVQAKSTKKPPTKLDLTKCLEVRHAWSRDPKSSRYTGTSTLRAKCKEGAANRSFALIYPHRTVDFTAMTVDQCKILMEGFSALCFRLQMARLEQQQDGDEESTHHTAMSAMGHEDDSETASLTGTNMSAPWGL